MDALWMFKAECEEERVKQGLDKQDVMPNKGYWRFLKEKSCTYGSLQKVAKALGMKVVICLMED